MIRRKFMKVAGAAALAGATASKVARADVPDHLWAGYDFGAGPVPRDRLSQGPFGAEQDEGWQVIASTTPSNAHIKNFGKGDRNAGSFAPNASSRNASRRSSNGCALAYLC